jgi:hypothetical protein
LPWFVEIVRREQFKLIEDVQYEHRDILNIDKTGLNK